MFYFNFKGVEETLFRQGMTGPEHIVLNTEEYWDEWIRSAAERREPDYQNLRLKTLCGRDLKYNPDYSRVRKESGSSRNCCEYCATEYEPDGPTFTERKEQQRIKDNGGLPF